jgi:hypothetical protein
MRVAAYKLRFPKCMLRYAPCARGRLGGAAAVMRCCSLLRCLSYLNLLSSLGCY